MPRRWVDRSLTLHLRWPVGRVGLPAVSGRRGAHARRTPHLDAGERRPRRRPRPSWIPRRSPCERSSSGPSGTIPRGETRTGRVSVHHGRRQNSRGCIPVRGAPHRTTMRHSGRPTSGAPCQRGPLANMPRSRPPVLRDRRNRARLVFPPCDQVRSGPRPRPADLLRQRLGRGLRAVVGPGSVGRRRRAEHRRTHEDTAPPERNAERPPLERRRRALGPDRTPCLPSGLDQPSRGPVTAGTPVRPPGGSFLRPDRAAS
jgi:hypothetical protein